MNIIARDFFRTLFLPNETTQKKTQERSFLFRIKYGRKKDRESDYNFRRHRRHAVFVQKPVQFSLSFFQFGRVLDVAECAQ